MRKILVALLVVALSLCGLHKLASIIDTNINAHAKPAQKIDVARVNASIADNKV